MLTTSLLTSCRPPRPGTRCRLDASCILRSCHPWTPPTTPARSTSALKGNAKPRRLAKDTNALAREDTQDNSATKESPGSEEET